MKSADLVITGEGAFDLQSLDGKVVGTIAEIAVHAERSIPVVVIAGDVTRAPDEDIPGVTAVFSLAEGVASRDDLIEDAASLLARRAVNVVSLVVDSRASGHAE
jgi:glycerate kinase